METCGNSCLRSVRRRRHGPVLASVWRPLLRTPWFLLIFVADVVSDSGEGWGHGPAKVAIVEPLLNAPEGLKEVTIDTGASTRCYFRLQAGERYVIITSGPRYAVAGCNPSFRLRGNEYILEAMRSRLNGEAPRLVGSVLKSTGMYTHGAGSLTLPWN